MSPVQSGDGASGTKPKPAPKPKPKPVPKPAPPVLTTAQKIVNHARELAAAGIHEIPAHSNQGPQVHWIQAATGAYGAPWCVSTVQRIILDVTDATIANRTASVYYLIDYGARNGWVVPRPVLGGPVCYRIGQGHAGTVVAVYPDGTFDAVEGNEADAVRLMHRDPRTLSCVFLKPPYLKA